MHVRLCLSCDATLDHCHGTLIVHTGRSVECTDADCHDTDHARHTFIVDCFDLAGGCACALPEPRSGPRSLAG